MEGIERLAHRGMTSSQVRSYATRFKGLRRFGFLVKGEAHIDGNGRVLSTEPITEWSPVPEEDFLDPYAYKY